MIIILIRAVNRPKLPANRWAPPHVKLQIYQQTLKGVYKTGPTYQKLRAPADRLPQIAPNYPHLKKFYYCYTTLTRLIAGFL